MTIRALSQLPVAVARVACSDGTHAILWEGGDLIALDHDDPEGERALAALGGQSCTCLDVLGAWTRQRGDAALLSALSRGPHDPVQPDGLWPGPFAPYPATRGPRNVVSAGRGGGMWRVGAGRTNSVSVTGVAIPSAAMAQHGSASFTHDDDVVLLAGLGHQLTLRLAATVTAALLDELKSPQDASPRPALEASLFGRASVSLRTWLGIPDLELELEVVEPDEEPTLDWDVGGPVRLALPLEWVMTVWGCDLTVVAGRFCLGVAASKGTGTTLMSVGSDLGAPRPLSIELL